MPITGSRPFPKLRSCYDKSLVFFGLLAVPCFEYWERFFVVKRGHMPIQEVSGDILESKAQAIVIPVNCVGVMGKGLALQFKKTHPLTFDRYSKLCKAGMVRIGDVKTCHPGTESTYWKILFPTKSHWRHPSKIEYIRSGLQDLSLKMGELGLSSIAIPALGCGLGGLDWAVVRPFIVETLDPWDHVTAFLYPPQ